MERFCDLHTHSVFSDGTYTPGQLLEEAQQRGLSAIALTDHNTAAGLPDFLEAARGYDVEAVPGVEFSTDYNGTELHILALYLKPEYFPQVMDLMQQYHQRKEQSNIDLVTALNGAGYDISYEKIKSATPEGQVNRALIAAELLHKGYVESVQDAFRKLLSPKCGYYVPPVRPTPKEMLATIRDLGAVSVWAHPYLSLKPEPVREFLQQAVSWGLQGMEVYYSTYDEATTAEAVAMADHFGLWHSGGSDFHGENKPDIALGVGRGGLRVPAALADHLRQKAEKGNF